MNLNLAARWRSRLLAGAAVAMCLPACSTLVYQEPQPGTMHVARVRFITTFTEIAVLRVYDDPDCDRNETEWMRLADHWLARRDPKSLGMPLWQYSPNAAKEVYVATDKQLNGMFFGAENRGYKTYSCATPFFFKFSDGHDYEVKYEWATENCQVRISELVQQGQNWTRAFRQPDQRFQSRLHGAIREDETVLAAGLAASRPRRAAVPFPFPDTLPTRP